MSDKQWAPEPWSVTCDYLAFRRGDLPRLQGWEIWTIGPNATGENWATDSGTIGYGMPYADALRAVACVNAMAGIADPAEYRKKADKLFSEIVRMDQEHAILTRKLDDLNQLVADLTEAARERDALRTQLEEAKSLRRRQADTIQSFFDAITRAGFDPCNFASEIDKMGDELKKLRRTAGRQEIEIDALKQKLWNVHDVVFTITKERDALHEQVKVLTDEVRARRRKAKWSGPHTCQEESDDCRACRLSAEVDTAAAATDAAGVEVKP